MPCCFSNQTFNDLVNFVGLDNSMTRWTWFFEMKRWTLLDLLSLLNSEAGCAQVIQRLDNSYSKHSTDRLIWMLDFDNSFVCHCQSFSLTAGWTSLPREFNGGMNWRFASTIQGLDELLRRVARTSTAVRWLDEVDELKILLASDPSPSRCRRLAEAESPKRGSLAKLAPIALIPSPLCLPCLY